MYWSEGAFLGQILVVVNPLVEMRYSATFPPSVEMWHLSLTKYVLSSLFSNIIHAPCMELTLAIFLWWQRTKFVE